MFDLIIGFKAFSGFWHDDGGSFCENGRFR